MKKLNPFPLFCSIRSAIQFVLKSGAILVMITGVLLLSLLVIPLSRASPGNLPLPAPSPRPPIGGGGGGGGGGDDGDGGGGGGGGGGSVSAIYGTVIDLSSSRPGAAIEVLINGAIVRTDTDGRYSVTGLNAGTYTVSLQLYGQGTPAQEAVSVTLDGINSQIVDLDFYSQTPPTDTPQPTVRATPTTTRQVTVAPRATPVALPPSGGPANNRPLLVIGLGLLLAVTGSILLATMGKDVAR